MSSSIKNNFKTVKMNTNTSLVLADTDTTSILEKLDAALKELKTIEETSYKTSGNVTGFAINIQKETLIPNLIRMGSVVKAKENAYNSYAEDILGLTNYPAFQDNEKDANSNSKNIDADIKLKIAIIQQKDKTEILKGFKERMSLFLSEAEQKANLIKEMEKFFKD